tara:strand:+ start:273 stop:803 length:531 start_codon:yes stop_codon:yes gene_type:complete
MTFQANVNLDSINGMLNNLKSAVIAANHDIATQVTDIGEYEMKKTITLSETPFGKLRIRFNIGNSAGRDRSGKMFDDVMAVVQKPRSKMIMGAFGWLKHWEKYYGLQEKGFTEYWKTIGFNQETRTFVFGLRNIPVWRKGIFSMRDARKAAINQLPKITKKAKKRIVNAVMSGGVY